MEKANLIIKKSKISGKGIFTKKQIKKGEHICTLKGEIISLKEDIERINKGVIEHSHSLQIDKETYIDLDLFSKTFNHSCSPNSFIKRKNELIAIRNIKKGEEITYDYSTTMDDNEKKIKEAGRTLWTCKCNCGAKNCRLIIDQFRTLPKDIKRYYLKNKYVPDFILKK